MREEVQEYLDSETDAEALDALVDIVVFALGTVERMGFAKAWYDAWNAVHKANMAKVVGPNSKRGSFKLDLQKPVGWKPPDIQAILEKHAHENK